MAWWKFEKGKAQDEMGMFPEAKFVGNAKMEAQVQEWIGLPFLRGVVAIDVRVRVLQQRVVLGMQGDDLDCDAFEVA